MTIKTSESFSATGAEFSIDLRKLEKLIDKNSISLLAKVQWNHDDRKTILSSLLKLSKTQSGIEKLFDLLGSAGAIGALFKVNCFDLLLGNYTKTGQLLEQICSDDL